MSKMKVVLDTNVLYSGLYSSNGASFRILNAIFEKKIKIAISTPLIFEYEDVLIRKKKILGLTKDEIEITIDSLCNIGEPNDIFFLWRPVLTDPKDDHILELAMASSANIIVTHNIKDFENAKKFNIRIQTPKQLLEEIK